MTDLNTLIPTGSGWVLTAARGINDNQQIVGWGVHSGQTRGFLWQIGSNVITDLGVLSGATSSHPKAINQTGRVAGGTATESGSGLAFLWTSPGPSAGLGTLPKDSFSDAWALNNASQVQVVGDSATSNAKHAVLWQGGKMIDLTKQLPAGSGWALEYAEGINDSGQIVGQGSSSSAGARHAFLLTPSSGGKNLATALTAGGTIQQVEAGILGSPEYFAHTGGTTTSFVTALYHDVLQRTPDVPSVAPILSFLNARGDRGQFGLATLTSAEGRHDVVDALFTQFSAAPPIRRG